MSGTSYTFSLKAQEKVVEKVVDDENVVINHIVLPQGDSLPPHRGNSHVHMIVLRGTLTLKLGEAAPKSYPSGEIVPILFQTPMEVSNQDKEPVEFFVIKSPNPKALS